MINTRSVGRPVATSFTVLEGSGRVDDEPITRGDRAAVRESTPWGVPDLRWDHVRRWFNRDDNGLLPDRCVPGTTVADWQAVLDLVRSRGWA